MTVGHLLVNVAQEWTPRVAAISFRHKNQLPMRAKGLVCLRPAKARPPSLVRRLAMWACLLRAYMDRFRPWGGQDGTQGGVENSLELVKPRPGF